jgi:hypothetical protein
MRGIYVVDDIPVPRVSEVVRWATTAPLDAVLPRGQPDSRAMELGTVAHALLAAHLTGTPPEVNDIHLDAAERVRCASAAAAAAVAVDRLLSELHAEIIMVEQPMVSARWRYGGTPDLVLRRHVDGAIMVCDLKTNTQLTASVPREMRLQLGAYHLLCEENPGRAVEGARAYILHSPMGGRLCTPREVEVARYADAFGALVLSFHDTQKKEDGYV